VDGKICDKVNAKCVECLSDYNCPSNRKHCTLGVCSACAGDIDCRSVASCNSTCVTKSLPYTCTNQSKLVCTGEEHCLKVQGRCAECEHDAECQNSKYGRYCTSTGLCTECLQDLNCRDASNCNSTCVHALRPFCTKNSTLECVGDELCKAENGTCYVGRFCSVSSDCTNLIDRFCSDFNNCTECLQDSHCKKDSSCGSTCKDLRCVGGSDCDSYLTQCDFTRGKCVSCGLTGSLDCPTFQVCNNGECVANKAWVGVTSTIGALVLLGGVIFVVVWWRRRRLVATMDDDTQSTLLRPGYYGQ
jgi:hypothetical protein